MVVCLIGIAGKQHKLNIVHEGMAIGCAFFDVPVGSAFFILTFIPNVLFVLTGILNRLQKEGVTGWLCQICKSFFVMNT